MCRTLCDSMDHNPPGSSVHGILQARILQWEAMPFTRSSQPSKFASLALQEDSLLLSHQGLPSSCSCLDLGSRVSQDSCRMAGVLGGSMRTLIRVWPAPGARTKSFPFGCGAGASRPWACPGSARGTPSSDVSAPFACPPAGELALLFQGLISEASFTQIPLQKRMAPPYAVTLWMSSNSLRGLLCRCLASWGEVPPPPTRGPPLAALAPSLILSHFLCSYVEFQGTKDPSFPSPWPTLQTSTAPPPLPQFHLSIDFYFSSLRSGRSLWLGEVSECGKGRGRCC